MILLMLWYYEIAIRQIKSNLIKMVAAIRAAFHIALSKEDWHYPHCQEGKDNWCRYHQDRVNGTRTYKPGPDSLLEKYLRDKTQN